MRLKMLVVLIAAMAALGACGDDKPSTTATGATSTTGDGSTGTDINDATAALGAIASSRCTEAAGAIGAIAASLPLAFAGGEADVADSVAELQAFTKGAPAAIRPDLEVLATGYAEIAAALKDANFDPASGKPPSEDALRKFQAATEKFEEADFEAAGERVNAWFTERCGK